MAAVAGIYTIATTSVPLGPGDGPMDEFFVTGQVTANTLATPGQVRLEGSHDGVTFETIAGQAITFNEADQIVFLFLGSAEYDFMQLVLDVPGDSAINYAATFNNRVIIP